MTTIYAISKFSGGIVFQHKALWSAFDNYKENIRILFGF